MEAAGIEPALDSSENGSDSRDITAVLGPILHEGLKRDAERYVHPIMGGFAHWKLDGDVNPQAALSPAASGSGNGPPASPSNFSAKTTICGIDFEVKSEGKHLNLHLIDEELFLWRFEPLESAIPKLEAILGAARLAANSE